MCKISIYRFAALSSLCISSFGLGSPDPANDCDDATRDITRLMVDDSKGTLDLSVTTAAPSSFASMLLFIDADNNPKTGFDAPAHRGNGFDLLVQGDALHRFVGNDRSAWQWESVAPVKRTVEGNLLKIEVPPANLPKQAFAVSALFMSDDYQVPRDIAPDGKPLAFTTKLTTGTVQAANVPLAEPRVDRKLPARKRFANAKSFYTYYGSKRVAELSHYDTVVLHTPAMAKEDVKTLSDLGVVTVGYITVGEDDQLRKGDGTGPACNASWYFDRNNDGEPDQNGIWKSWFANAGDPKWREDRVKEAKRLVHDYGFNGIFLDTIDTSTNYPESKQGMIQLIADFRKELPEAVIVLNQGFEVLPQVAQYADGLMLESFTATYDFDTKQYMMNLPQSLDYHTRRAQRTIQPVLSKHPLKVLVLDYAKRDDIQSMQTAADRAASFGYLFSAAPIFLDDVYPNVPAGKADPKWLQMQASPQAMSFTLPKDQNGFPSGTKLIPSGCFAGYTIAPIVDGVMDRSKLPWSKAAWASMEDGEPAWIELQLSQPHTGGMLRVYFHDEAGPSRAYRIDVMSVGANEWTTVEAVKNNTQRDRAHALPAKPFKAIRLWQGPGGGSTNRPDLMWIAQIVLEKE